jgi:YidC/Oxa1 family membrane protein insertase
MPIFYGLFFVLNEAQNSKARGTGGVGLMNESLSNQFAVSELFGAPLKDTFLTSSTLEVKILAAVMILVMTTTQFITQKQIMAKNQNPDVQNSQFAQTQKIMLYAFPVIFLISGISFPLGVLIYWLVSNFWTMGQQFVVIKRMPTPGSIAHNERQARLLKKGKITEDAPAKEVEAPQPAQRVQPVSKARAKKKPNGKK